MDKQLYNFGLPLAKLNKVLLKELKSINEEIVFVIKNEIKNEVIIECLLDKLLDLTEYFYDDIEISFFLLLDYYKNINQKASSRYEQMYLEIINCDLSMLHK